MATVGESHRVMTALERHPAWATAAGALCVSASAIFIHLARTTPGTVSVYRCVLALPFLLVFTVLERPRSGSTTTAPHPRGGPATAPRPRSPLTTAERVVAWAAGALLAADMLLWAAAVTELGAGPSTVVVNLQVVLVPLIAWIVDREPVGGRFLLVLPVLLLGVVLTGGVLGAHTGAAPGRGLWHAAGAALSYAGFLFLLRRSSRRGHSIRSMVHVTVASGVTSLAVGAVWQGIHVRPDPATLGWLLALAVSGQVIGWLLVATGSPHLPSRTAAVLLLLTPVGALVLAALVLAERPAPSQLLGCLLVLLSVPLAARAAAPRREPGQQGESGREPGQQGESGREPDPQGQPDPAREPEPSGRQGARPLGRRITGPGRTVPAGPPPVPPAAGRGR